VAPKYTRRTVITRVRPSDEAAALLDATIEEYKAGCQLATDLAWPDSTTRDDVHSLAYHTLREETDLLSMHAAQAIDQAAEAIAACNTLDEDGYATSKPTFTADTILYNDKTMQVFSDETVALSTIGDRVRVPLALPADPDGYQHQYLNADEWDLVRSSLTKTATGAYDLHLGFRREPTDVEADAMKHHTDETATENGTVLGVAVGTENIAATSTGRFFSAGDLDHWQREYDERRESMQRRGTRWAHRNMKRVDRKERGRFKSRLHEVANALVREALANDCTHIVFERLVNIRARFVSDAWLRWGGIFRALHDYVAYKAVTAGITVRWVKPRSPWTTVRECSRSDCGCAQPGNRPESPDHPMFHCVKCGYEVHRDYNMSKTIAVKYAKKLRRLHKTSGGGGPVSVPLNSGALTVEGPGTVVPG